MVKGSAIHPHRHTQQHCRLQLTVPLLLQIKSSVDPKKTEYQLRGESAGKVFRVDKNTGDVYALERLDREKISEYHLTALVVDKDSKKNLESPSSFTIKVHDVNHALLQGIFPTQGLNPCLLCLLH